MYIILPNEVGVCGGEITMSTQETGSMCHFVPLAKCVMGYLFVKEYLCFAIVITPPIAALIGWFLI